MIYQCGMILYSLSRRVIHILIPTKKDMSVVPHLMQPNNIRSLVALSFLGPCQSMMAFVPTVFGASALVVNTDGSYENK